MGYAGYVPAKLPPSKLTPVEQAVQAVKSLDCLEIMGKLLYNCAVSPREEKYRRIKLTNKRLAETLGANPAALEALTALGWVADAANSHELVVPEGVYFTMKEVRMVEAAKEKVQKDMRSSSNKNLAAMVSVQA
jgi:hypothetical protein